MSTMTRESVREETTVSTNEPEPQEEDQSYYDALLRRAEQKDQTEGRRRSGAFAKAIRRVQSMTDEEKAREDREHAAALAAESAARVQHLLWDSYAKGRPADFEDSCFARLLPQQDPEGRVSQWWRSGKKNLLMAGPPSKGKTDAAYAICNEVASDVREGRTSAVTVRAWSVVELRELLRPPAQHEARDEVRSAARARAVRDVRQCDLLLLDDLTAVSTNDWFREELFKVIDARTADPRRRTIVTANASKQTELGPTLENAVGSPIVARLRKDTVPAWIDGEDLRRFAGWDPFA